MPLDEIAQRYADSFYQRRLHEIPLLNHNGLVRGKISTPAGRVVKKLVAAQILLSKADSSL